MPKEKRIEKHLPLTESTFYILAALVEPKHGYAVMQEVEGASEGLVALGPGTLYGALTNLENSKLIRKMGEDDRRKIYCITEFGQQVLLAHVERLEVMLRNAKLKRKIIKEMRSQKDGRDES